MLRLSKDKVTSCLWVYTEINDPWEGKRSTFPDLNNEDKERYLREINFGVDQKHTRDFLTFLEYATREEATQLTIELTDVPPRTPRWLDDPTDYFSWPRMSFRELSIVSDSRSYCVMDTANLKFELHVTREKCFELFSRVYICNTIYATGWDNIVQVDLKSGLNYEKRDFVVWGVVNGEPIHY
ncbi:hypothetical protein WBG78_16275 [Chryseolinea sp. T2]|uniref:hypothetical protein n=1 Tax=Chryseolinea sp. T2 TaxID=3129255 RepID=UPI00307764A8